MKASVVIPAYNRRSEIVPVLAALEKQILTSGCEYEVLVVDDGSNDGTQEAVSALQPDYDLRYEYLPRTDASCAGAARNHGIERATGDVVIMIDADGIPPPHFIQSHLDVHRLRPDVAVVGLRSHLKDGPIDIERLRQGQFAHALPDIAWPDIRCELMQKYSHNAGNLTTFWHLFFSCNASVGTEHLRKIGGFDTGFKGWGLEDCEVGFRLRNTGLKFFCARDATVYDQYRNMDDQAIKFRSWWPNFQYFKKKFEDSTDVSLQEIFADFFNPPGRVSWHECFHRFEAATRNALGRPVASGEVTIIEIAHALQKSDLENISESNRTRDVVIIDGHQDLHNDVAVQSLSAHHNLYYFRIDDLPPRGSVDLRAFTQGKPFR